MKKRVVAVAWIVAAGFAASACSEATSSLQNTQFDAVSRLRATATANAPIGAVRAADPLAQVVGNIHRDAMLDAIKNSSQWLAASGGSDKRSRVCNAAQMIAVKYGERIDSAFHVHRPHAELVATARQGVDATAYCRNPGTMSVFNAAAIPVALALDPDSVPTGDFLEYLDDISAAVEQSDGSPTQVYSAMNSILSSASSLSYADYQVVASAAGLAESSADTWDTQVWGSSGDLCASGQGICIQQPYSIFATSGWLRKSLIAAGADAIGCASGAASTWFAAAAGPPGWAALGIQCGIWGIGASAGTALAFLT